MTAYNKAIVATVGAVVAILNAAGVPVAESVSESKALEIICSDRIAELNGTKQN